MFLRFSHRVTKLKDERQKGRTCRISFNESQINLRTFTRRSASYVTFNYKREVPRQTSLFANEFDEG